mmetsp:Transcript_10086/g.25274  ORF Transcript_10086/g.25274 Transcript_10086/m.25274 type:complete len:255 (+) Transcript_10086:635-1399(+)
MRFLGHASRAATAGCCPEGEANGVWSELIATTSSHAPTPRPCFTVAGRGHSYAGWRREASSRGAGCTQWGGRGTAEQPAFIGSTVAVDSSASASASIVAGFGVLSLAQRPLGVISDVFHVAGRICFFADDEAASAITSVGLVPLDRSTHERAACAGGKSRSLTSEVSAPRAGQRISPAGLAEAARSLTGDACHFGRPCQPGCYTSEAPVVITCLARQKVRHRSEQLPTWLRCLFGAVTNDRCRTTLRALAAGQE